MGVLILVVIVIAVWLALRYLKKHGSSCGGGCEGCTMDCQNRKKK